MRAFFLKALLVIVMAVAGYGAVEGLAKPGGPSFDCSKAMAPDEKAICADPDLSRLDVLINSAFKLYNADFRSKKDIAHELNAARGACGSDSDCILLVEANTLEIYGTVPKWAESRRSAILLATARNIADKTGGSSTLPQRIGECSTTRITGLGTRFSEGVAQLANADETEGSSVQFENQLGLVSYEREAALAKSKVGDPVIACLASIPRDCPSGDVRGRVYFVLNQRTNGTWALPDSQHMCGGA